MDSPKTFTTNVEIVRIRPISRDEKDDTILTIDVELSYLDCPGQNRKFIRGNKEFAACISAHKVGDKVPAKLWWGPKDDRSQYTNKIVALAECKRTPDPKDEASYEMVQDCEDMVVNGVSVGVHCDRKRNKRLLTGCPWFQVR